MNTKLFLFIGTSLSFIPTFTFAQCVATQDCSTLGYTETSCSGGKGVKCPFGNKWACFKSDSEFCNEYGFTYTCTGTNQTGGASKACNGKYYACTCADGYEWKDGSCQKQVLNGAVGELYYCNGKVVGVRATGTNFYVAMKDLGTMNWSSANSSCQNYSFCDNAKGTLPTADQLQSIYNNKSRVNSLLSTNGGAKLTEDYYWSSVSAGYYDGYNYYGSLNMSNGYGWNASNISSNYVRPVLTSW